MLQICAHKDSTRTKMFGLLSLTIVSPFQGQTAPVKVRNIVVKHSLTFRRKGKFLSGSSTILCSRALEAILRQWRKIILITFYSHLVYVLGPASWMTEPDIDIRPGLC